MSKNYLIGVGGTGARVVEAVVHCCAAGFGPKELSVFLVDPDEGNGNLSRTKTLLANYEKCRTGLAEHGRTHRPLFGTQISTPPKVVWGIFEDQGKTLDAFINYTNDKLAHPEFAGLVELLFSQQELSTALNEGFRGHPNIGAVVMANARHDEEPWKTFWNDVELSQGEGAVRVFLVGSIFGGTGAAGVPTFGAPDMVKFNQVATIDRAKGKSKILLGGALVLPYFTIDMNVDGPDRSGQMFVTAADFPLATKAALQYYGEKEKNLAFDQLYFIGDSLGQKVGQFSPGNKTQDNRPHYIEVVTALAAFDFFRQQDPKTAEHLFFSACRDGQTVDWTGLPSTRYSADIGDRSKSFQLSLTTMAVFAYAFATLGRETLTRDPRDILDNWYNESFAFTPGRAQDSARDPRTYPELEMIAKYCEAFLVWIAALDDDDGGVLLIDRSRLFKDGKLRPYTEDDRNLSNLLKGAASKLGGFSRYRRELDALPPATQVPMPDRYVNLFYDAAVEFAKTY